jgi:hypothetical protein
MRLALALLVFGLLALGFLLLTDRPSASRGSTPHGAEPVHAAPAPSMDEAPPAPERRATDAPEESPAPPPPADDFPHALVAGHVVHHDGAPAAGVMLEVRAQNQRGRSRSLAALRTEKDGFFEARVLGAGPFRLEARAESGGGVRLSTALEAVPADARALVLILPHSGRLRGRVVDDRGEPVRAFTLVLRREDASSAVREVVESEDGTFESEELAAGPWQLVVSAAGYGPSVPDWTSVPDETRRTIRLQRACRLGGVVRSHDGRPRAGAHVELSSAFEPVFADADGAFVISGRPGLVSLQATDPSGEPGEALQLTVGPGEERAGLALRLGASGRVSGRVVTLANRPASGRSVVFRRESETSPPPAITDELGLFRVDLPPGRWTAAVALDEREIEALELAAPSAERPAEIWTSERVDVHANEAAEVWLALAPAPVRVSGALTKAGEPCQGGEVEAIDPRGPVRYRARVEGTSYALGLGRPGLHEFRVTLGTTTQSLWVDVPALGAHELDLDVPVGWVAGFVRALDGASVADVEVWANAPPDTHGGGAGHALTDAVGNFVLELAPGTYDIGAGTPQTRQHPWSRGHNVTVRERERLTGLELVLPREQVGPALEVVLRGPRGELVEGGLVRVTMPGREVPEVLAVAAPLGSASFAALQSSSVEVAAEAPGYFLAEHPRVRIEWGKPRRLELVLARAFEVVVRVRSGGASGPVHDLDAVATSGLVFDSAPIAADDQRGEPCFRWPLLPLGEYRVRVFAGEQVHERVLRVGGGGTEPADLELSVP